MERPRCECPDRSLTHAAGACPSLACYAVLRSGARIAVCADCTSARDREEAVWSQGEWGEWVPVESEV